MVIAALFLHAADRMMEQKTAEDRNVSTPHAGEDNTRQYGDSDVLTTPRRQNDAGQDDDGDVPTQHGIDDYAGPDGDINVLTPSGGIDDET